jgi:signal transduction histidine kinase
MATASVTPSKIEKIFSRPPVRLASLLFALVVVIATGALALFTEAGVADSRNWVVHSYEVRRELDALQLNLAKAGANAMSYVQSQAPEDAEQFRENREALEDAERALHPMTADNPKQAKRLNDLEPLIAEEMERFERCTSEAGCGAPQSAVLRELEEGNAERLRGIATIIQGLDADEDALLRQRLNRLDMLFRRNLLTLAVAFGVAIVLLLYNFRLLTEEIAARKEKEKLERENTESYRALSGRILELQDIERRKIARELHDSVGQYLTALKMTLARFARRTDDKAVDAREWLPETIALADQAIEEVRTISHLLHPPLLDELGFESAARWYTEEFAKRSGTKVKTTVADIVGRLSKEIELALFRVLQEALTNVHRHAKAQSIDVNVWCTDSDVILIVRDDGKGIPAAVIQRFREGLAAGIGLAGMRERLADLDGTLEVESSPKGTSVKATLPTKKDEDGDPRSVEPYAAESGKDSKSM